MNEIGAWDLTSTIHVNFTSVSVRKWSTYA